MDRSGALAACRQEPAPTLGHPDRKHIPTGSSKRGLVCQGICVHTCSCPQTLRMAPVKTCPCFAGTVLYALRSAFYQFMNPPNSPEKLGGGWG